MYSVESLLKITLEWIKMLFDTRDNINIKTVLDVLSTIRINLVFEEYKLQQLIEKKLAENNIPYQKEYKLAPHNRIDFLVADSIGLEVKKGKPYSRQVVNQLSRYASFSEITSIVVIVEKKVDVPKELNGKRIYILALNKLWGVAL